MASTSVQILKDSNQNLELAEKGYTIFSFFTETEIEELKSALLELHGDIPDRFYASTHSDDAAFRKKVSDFIRVKCGSHVKEYFSEINFLGGAFISKPGGGKGILPPHQDWNIVDEKKATSYNLWIPLVDTFPENGAFHLIEGSHLWIDSLRGPNLPNPFEKVNDLLWKYLQPLRIPAGSALLYDHRLLHASPVNQTDEARIAIVAGIIAKDAEMLYYYRNQDQVDVHQSNPEYFLNEDPMKGPGNLVKIRTEDYSFPKVSEKQLMNYLGQKIEDVPPTFLQRIFRRFMN